MRVLFEVAGDADIGMGHVRRSIELANEMRLSTIDVAGFVCNRNEQSMGEITKADLRCFPGLALNHVDDVDFLDGIIRQERVDVVVFDRPGRLAPKCEALRAAFPGLFLVALDNFDMDNGHVDMLVNLFNHNPQRTSPRSPSVRYYEGPSFGIVRRAFDRFRGAGKTICRKPEHILVSFGGGDPRRNTLRVLAGLHEGISLQATFHLVVGANYPHRAVAKEMAAELPVGHRFYQDLSDIEQLMHRCDLGVIGAGTTMIEMACLGIPALVLPQSEEESRFAAYFAQHGAVRNLGLNVNGGPARIRDAIVDLSSDVERRQAMSHAARRLVDGQGRRRIVDLIMRNVELGRKRTMP